MNWKSICACTMVAAGVAAGTRAVDVALTDKGASIDAGGALLGTCAGAILLAREVTSPRQESLGLLDVVVERNAFGRQVDRFEVDLKIPAIAGKTAEVPYHAVFIRAPLIQSVQGTAQVLSALPDGRIVAAQQGRLLATSFHPELTHDMRFHRYFVELCK